MKNNRLLKYIFFVLSSAMLLNFASCATDEREEEFAARGTPYGYVPQPEKMPPPILTPIYFPTNITEIPEFHWRELFFLAQYLRFNHKARLEIEGHADLTGNVAHNKMLGTKRADAVKEMLAFFGAPVDQLFTISMGQDCPAMVGSTPMGLKFNRRVELVLRLGEPKDNRDDLRESLIPAHYSRAKCF